MDGWRGKWFARIRKSDGRREGGKRGEGAELRKAR